MGCPRLSLTVAVTSLLVFTSFANPHFLLNEVRRSGPPEGEELRLGRQTAADGDTILPKTLVEDVALTTTKGVWRLFDACNQTDSSRTTPTPLTAGHEGGETSPLQCLSSVLFLAHDPMDRMSNSFWKSDPGPLLDQFDEPSFHLVFLSYQNDTAAASDVEDMERRFQEALSGRSQTERQRWESRLHFVTESGWTIKGWVGAVVKDWGKQSPFSTHALSTTTATCGSSSETTSSVTNMQIYPLLETQTQSSIPPHVHPNLRQIDVCDPSESTMELMSSDEEFAALVRVPKSVTRMIECVNIFEETKKEWSTSPSAATSGSWGVGVAAVLLSHPSSHAEGRLEVELEEGDVVGSDGHVRGLWKTAAEQLVTLLTCNGDHCERQRDEFPFVGFAHPSEDFTADAEEPLSSNGHFQGCLSFAVDGKARLRATGFTPFDLGDAKGTLQIFDFEKSIDDKTRGGHAITIFDGSKDRVHANLTTVTNIPTVDEIVQFDSLYLEIDLGCDDHLDSNCGEWDYTLDMFSCPTDYPHCDLRMARWITAYGREGRWFTQSDPLFAHLMESAGDERAFTLKIDHRQQYNVTLTMWLLKDSEKQRPSFPAEAIPIFSGGDLDGHYNSRQTPKTISLANPENVHKIEVASLISGHGFGVDERNCAEFCNITEHFVMDGQKHIASFPEAGIRGKCMDKVDLGVVPNQRGTWPTGRNGWCPGWDVKWTRFEQTLGAVAGAAEVQVEYRALYDGEEYTPHESTKGLPPRVDLVAYLVVHRPTALLVAST